MGTMPSRGEDHEDPKAPRSLLRALGDELARHGRDAVATVTSSDPGNHNGRTPAEVVHGARKMRPDGAERELVKTGAVFAERLHVQSFATPVESCVHHVSMGLAGLG